jgi:hypothetical protein
VVVWTGTVGGSGNVKTYVNGSLADNFDYSQLAMDGRPVVDIGRHNPNAPMWFDGQIDDVRIYNRALSEDEVKYLYEVTAPNYE